MSAVTSPSLSRRQWYETDPILERLRPEGMPILFEDEGLEMGESDLHTYTCDIALYGLEFHLAKQPSLRVFSNLNLYYSDESPNMYVSPDIMVIEPTATLPQDVASYSLGKDGPAPRLVTEVLSFRTYQEGDLSSKPVLYAELGISEYMLVDVTGELLPRRLLLLRRRKNGRWAEHQDDDGGVTSQLGFRFVIDKDGHLRVLDAATGKRYARPDEAQAEAEARRLAEGRIRELEAELERLRGSPPRAKSRKASGKRRRKK